MVAWKFCRAEGFPLKVQRVSWISWISGGDLVVGAEPADVAGGFFAGAFGVEGDEVVEDKCPLIQSR